MTTSELYCDTRMGGKKQWVIGDPREANMRIPDDYKNCVFFLCSEDYTSGTKRMRYGGTGFFISVASEQYPNDDYIYMVTAKHNIIEANKIGDIYARINKANGSAIVKITSEWIFPEDEGVDIAITPVFNNPSMRGNFPYVHLSSNVFATDDVVTNARIGIGEELFILGLFTRHHGKEQNIPVLRSGVLAAMPQEPLEDINTGCQYNAFLAEVRSIGGLSGSPVFVFPDKRYFGSMEITEEENDLRGGIYLLGLIRGHWDSKSAAPDIDYGDDDKRAVNMGMAIVTPINGLHQLLLRDDVVKERRKLDRARRMENAPTLDSAFGSDDHASRFLNAVKALATTPKSEFDKEEQNRKSDEK